MRPEGRLEGAWRESCWFSGVSSSLPLRKDPMTASPVSHLFDRLQRVRPTAHEPKPLSGVARSPRTGAGSQRGERSEQQDRFLVAELRRRTDVIHSSHVRRGFERDRGQGWIFAVADGVGGRPGGAEAAECAVDEVLRYVGTTLPWQRLGEAQSAEPLAAAFRQLFRRAEGQVRSIGDAFAHPPATTLTVALLVRPMLFVAHAGDSRAYLYRSGGLRRLTCDHTLGAAAPDADLPDHVLVNSVGGPEQDVRVELTRHRVREDDVLLLASDGITDTLSDDDLARELARLPEVRPQDTVDRLLALAEDAGGRDNRTAVLSIL
jgi:serine/threonine protein phosphatase PrpC